VENVKDTF